MAGSCGVGAGTVAEGAGGIATVARLSIRALGDMGIRPRALSLLDRGRINVHGCAVAGCQGQRPLFAARTLWNAWRSDIALYDALGVSRAHPKVGPTRPVAAWIHGVEVWHGLTPAYRRALERLDLVLCNSHYTLERHQEMHGPLPQARVCRLATEEDESPPRRAAFNGRPLALIVGRIDASEGLKGHAELIASWPRVVAAVPNARLLIAGGGSGVEALRKRIAASPVGDSIELMGFVAAALLPSLFERAHVFAMPSRQEGFGIAYVEAMRYGLPCIASSHDGGQEVNVDGSTGFNVNLNRRDELAERLIALLSDSDLAQRMGENAEKRWRENFRYSAFAVSFGRHMREFMSRAAGTHGA
jgi:phosphatidylinositol alpha-1,6-mannosyltransferase